jgi:hypothetical protein
LRRQPIWIQYGNEKVLDEAPVVHTFTDASPKVVLEIGKRTNERKELYNYSPSQRERMDVDEERPAEREKATKNHEQYEQEVQDQYKVSDYAQPVPSGRRCRLPTIIEIAELLQKGPEFFEPLRFFRRITRFCGETFHLLDNFVGSLDDRRFRLVHLPV